MLNILLTNKHMRIKLRRKSKRFVEFFVVQSPIQSITRRKKIRINFFFFCIIIIFISPFAGPTNRLALCISLNGWERILTAIIKSGSNARSSLYSHSTVSLLLLSFLLWHFFCNSKILLFFHCLFSLFFCSRLSVDGCWLVGSKWY